MSRSIKLPKNKKEKSFLGNKKTYNNRTRKNWSNSNRRKLKLRRKLIKQIDLLLTITIKIITTKKLNPKIHFTKFQ